MTALDNAGALSKADIAELSNPLASEVPRRMLTREDILSTIQTEIETRTASARDFEKLGRADQVDLIDSAIAKIRAMKAMLK